MNIRCKQYDTGKYAATKANDAGAKSTFAPTMPGSKRRGRHTQKVRCKAVLSLAVAAVLGASLPMTASAQQSPEFARTSEEWALLRDNTLDYTEIPALIHEYNTTVLFNALEYKKNRDKTSSDIAQTYYDAADDIMASLDYPSADSPTYASQITAYLSSIISAENLQDQGDTNTNDAYTEQLTDTKEEATLVKQAQEAMISYWTQKISIQTYQSALEQAQANLGSVSTKIAAGTATAASLSAAQQQVTSAQAQLESAQTKLESAKESLCLMLGWSYGADVNITELPEITAEQIAAIDLNADLETAKTNNYALAITNRQLSNAKNASTAASLKLTKEETERTIGNSVSSLYQSLTLAWSDYGQAVTALGLQQQTADTAARKLAAGMLTQTAYNTIAAGLTSAQINVQAKKYAVLKAYNSYIWAVNGLA